MYVYTWIVLYGFSCGSIAKFVASELCVCVCVCDEIACHSALQVDSACDAMLFPDPSIHPLPISHSHLSTTFSNGYCHDDRSVYNYCKVPSEHPTPVTTTSP